MSLNKEDIGVRIREIRKRAKMNQDQLGSLLGVSKTSVSGYENGDGVPVEALIKIAELGNVSLDWLIKGEEPPKQPAPYVNEPHIDYGPDAPDITQIAKLIQGHPGSAKKVFDQLIDFYAEEATKTEER